VGVQLNLPLDRLRERNQYRSTLISFESAIRRLGLNFDEVRNQIDRDIRQLEQLRKSYQIQKNAVTLAENSVEGNELRLKAGTITFQSLSDSQDDLIDAQNAVTGALVDYLEARLGLLTNLGILATDEETFWLRGDAVKVDLSKWRSAPTVTEAPTETSRNQVPTPEEVFAD
jgi:outer membrane protein TolC